MPGSKEPLSIKKVAELFKHKHISFGSLQKNIVCESDHNRACKWKTRANLGYFPKM